MKFDILVVGCDLAAAIMAERLANDLGKTVLVVDHRSHIGGHCYDRWSNNGVRVDQYGLKFFHGPVKYLNPFASWRPVKFEIGATTKFGWVKGVPSNSIRTVDREKIKNPANAEEYLLSLIGVEITRIYQNYFERLFGCDLDEVRVSAMKAHLERESQVASYLPTDGFTRMTERLLKSDKIKVMLQCHWRAAIKNVAFSDLVFTGPMDDYFHHCYLPLQYRSMAFEFNDCDYASHQPCLQINNCDKGEHSRVIDYGYLAPHPVQRTTICTEYPKSSGEPFYPMLTADARAEHAKYAELAATEKHVTFVGPLANYRDERLDDTVASTLAAYERLKISLTSGKAR